MVSPQTAFDAQVPMPRDRWSPGSEAKIRAPRKARSRVKAACRVTTGIGCRVDLLVVPMRSYSKKERDMGS